MLERNVLATGTVFKELKPTSIITECWNAHLILQQVLGARFSGYFNILTYLTWTDCSTYPACLMSLFPTNY